MKNSVEPKIKGYLTTRQAKIKYGACLDKMKKTGYLDGITCMIKNDTIYCPESDYELAYRASKGKRIHPWEVD